MATPFDLADDLGPSKVLHLWRPSVGLKAIVVVDNVAAGPSIGGTRMEPDVSLEECARLARAMTLKNAVAGLPHGGGKSVIFADPSMPADRKEALIRAFAGAIADFADYIPGPDMGTNEQAMAWVHDEIGRAVGLPREIGGIPLDEIGATGYGLMAAAEAAEEVAGMRLKGARVAVQGFGAVGQHGSRFLAEKGSVLVAAADSHATVVNPDGMDVAALIAHKKTTGKVEGFAGTRTLKPEDVIGVDCEIWIPAARPDVLRKDNVNELEAKLVLEGANIPATAEAEKIMHDKGILVVPDFIANAGGVICAAVEYHRGSEVTAFAQIREKILANTREVLTLAKAQGLLPRAAADAMARARVGRAMANRRWH